MNASKMQVGSLFTGSGGLDLGLERAGMQIAWQCEQDEKCQIVLGRHWPTVPCYDDVRSLCRQPKGRGSQLGSDCCESRSTTGHEAANVSGVSCHSGPNIKRGVRSETRSVESPGRVDLLCGGFPCQDLSVAGKRAGLGGDRSGLFFEAARIADAVLDGGGVARH